MDERYENELQHWGIKNMKWGQRRFQNEDGSLTAAGRIRYGVGKAREKIGSAAKVGIERHKVKVAAKKEEKRIEELMKKPIRKLSEAEMQERKDRANKERELKQIESQNHQAARSFLSKFGEKMVNDIAIDAVASAGKKVATKFLEEAFTKAVGLDPNTYDLFKKAGFNTRKLTDAQIDALESRTKKENTIYQQNSNIERQQANREARNNDDSNDDSNNESSNDQQNQNSGGNNRKKKKKRNS